MGTKYYVSKEALNAKGKDYFEDLWLDNIKRHANEWVDGIYYEQNDMYNYWLCLNPEEDNAFELFAED